MKAAALTKTGATGPFALHLSSLRRIATPARPTVDQVMVEERAASFTKRSIKTSAKLAGLKMAVRMWI